MLNQIIDLVKILFFIFLGAILLKLIIETIIIQPIIDYKINKIKLELAKKMQEESIKEFNNHLKQIIKEQLKKNNE